MNEGGVNTVGTLPVSNRLVAMAPAGTHNPSNHPNASLVDADPPVINATIPLTIANTLNDANRRLAGTDVDTIAAKPIKGTNRGANGGNATTREKRLGTT